MHHHAESKFLQTLPGTFSKTIHLLMAWSCMWEPDVLLLTSFNKLFGGESGSSIRPHILEKSWVESRHTLMCCYPNFESFNNAWRFVILHSKKHAVFAVHITHQQVILVPVIGNSTVIMLVWYDVQCHSLTWTGDFECFSGCGFASVGFSWSADFASFTKCIMFKTHPCILPYLIVTCI